MPIILAASNLNLQYVNPQKFVDSVDVRPASWIAQASVTVQNEIGRTWRVGFVQILTHNLVRATYANTEVSEVVTPGANLPVLDGPNSVTHRPFYDDNTATPIERPKDYTNTALAPAQTQQMAMYDRPRSRFAWYHNGALADPLQEVQMNLQFTTFVLARDITMGAGIGAPYTVQVLKEWTVQLQRRYYFNVQAGLNIAGQQMAHIGQTTFRVANPNQRPMIMNTNRGLPANAHGIFTGQIANNVFGLGTTPRNRVRPRGNVVQGLAQIYGG